MSKSRVLLLVDLLVVLMLSTLAAQSKPDFSGTWVLDRKAQTSGGRGGGGTVSMVSGAPVNCGTECTIVQNAKTLTISRRVSQEGVKAPDVVLNLDGGESTIVQSLSPRVEYTATAKWDRDRLVVTRSMGYFNIVQTIEHDDGKLSVASAFTVEGDVPVTLTYTRK